MLGLQRNTVKLESHQPIWDSAAKETISLLWSVLKDTAADIQHIGSTAIPSISAKPIIDIAVGMHEIEDIQRFIPELEEKSIIFRGPEHNGQYLFVIGDFEKDTRTHHIHVVKWKSVEWNHYIDFRDYLIANPSKAAEYHELKLQLEKQYPNDRIAYTEGKAKLVDAISFALFRDEL